MRILIGAEGLSGRPAEAEEELRSLHAWLLADPAVRRHATSALTSSAPPADEDQGPVLDILSLVLGGTFDAGALAVAVLTWRGTRPRQPAITVERPDGTKITITDTSPQEARRLVEDLLAGEPSDNQ
ncbi:hypothetical protein OIE52_14515 [Streptomyces canus]|uniref:effector-associated constant component EACC1 n=1 Tax=Streptomyces canus TaxID=58343 RepID=UPI002E2E3B2B|nr:hypothetical protein [Streptomyces canus]